MQAVQGSYTEPSRRARNKKPLKRSPGSALSKLIYWALQAGKEQETTEKNHQGVHYQRSYIGPGRRLARNKEINMECINITKIVSLNRAGWQGT